MIAASTLVSAIAEARCAITQAKLAPDEALVSRAGLPALYDPSLDASTDTVLRSLIKHTVDFSYKKQFAADDALEQVRRFWARVLSRAGVDSAARESVLQAYLFFFWNRVRSHSGDEPIAYDEGFIPQVRETWESDSNFCIRLVSRAEKDAPVDILAREGTTVYLIEVKYGDVDDRAIGQLLRYFERMRHLCNSVDHLCDLRSVVPVLVAKGFPPSNWSSLPTSMRELIRVYFYAVEDDFLMLRDGRRTLQNQLKGDRRYFF